MNSLDDFHLQSKPPNNRTTPIGDIAARLRGQLESLQPAIDPASSPEMTCEPGSASPQPAMFPALGHWYSAADGDSRARAIFDRHYSRIHYKDGRKPKLFVGPGEKMVLLTSDCKALFIWRKFISGDGQTGVNCAVFRNEGPVQSSELIRQACELAWQRWPGERLYTYVDAASVQSTNPGYCFKMAGWQACGQTKVNKLLILECLPLPTSPSPDLPIEASPAITTPESASMPAGLTVGSVCAGVGGFDLGFARAGHVTKFCIEIDSYRQRSLQKNFHGSAIFADLKADNDLPSVDILCGGIPCQPFSVVGKRKGSADERDLWPDFLRAICKVRPRYIVLENVAGLLSSNEGRDFGRILRDLAKNGYDAEWDCISAAAAGAAHIRERLFLLAYPAQDNRPGREILRAARAALKVCREAQQEREIEWWGGRAFRTSPNVGVRAYPNTDVLGMADAVPPQLDIDRMMALGDSVDPVITEAIGRAILADFQRNMAEQAQAPQLAPEETWRSPSSPVQIWPTLARLAIASGEGPYLRLWALLSEYSRRDGGRGSFRLNSESLNELACTLGITPSTLSTLVRKGDGIYWSRGGNRLWQVSAVKLYEHLQSAAKAAAIAGYDEPNRRKMLIPLECFSSLELFYATCLNAWLMDRKAGEFMVTWKVLTAWWGRNRACLNRWMDIAGIQRTENWGKRRIGTADRRTGLFDVIQDPETGNPNMVVESQGQLWLMYQRGNTYYANQSVSRARRGAFKLLNASSGNSLGASPRPDAEQWQRDNLKANFHSVDAHSRYQKKHGLPDISYTLAAEEVLVGPRVRGRRVWRAWEASVPTRK